MVDVSICVDFDRFFFLNDMESKGQNSRNPLGNQMKIAGIYGSYPLVN